MADHRSIVGRRHRAAAAAAAALTVAALVLVAPAPGTGAPGAPTTPARPSAAPITPTVLAAAAVSRPWGVAPAPDGTVYVSQEATAQVFAVAADGTRTALDLDLEAPAGLFLDDDGTLYIADGTRVTTMAPDGSQGTVAVDGAVLLGWVGVDAAGGVTTLDRNTSRVVRTDPDGSQEVLTFTGVNLAGGLDVTDDGVVSVLDIETGDVVRRQPDGTQTSIAVAGATAGQSVDVEGDRIVVGGPAATILREADGTTSNVIDRGLATQVLLQADGTVWAAYTGISGCRCPEPAGAVYRVDPGNEPTTVPLGDLVEFGSVAAGAPGTVLYTSWNGPQGYSDLNPLRLVSDDGSSEDLPVTDATVVDAAPDGTQYLLLESGAGSGDLVRRSVDGTITPIDLPTEPGIDQVVDISVDDDGRLYVAMGSGYGPGAFAIVEPLAAGGPQVRYRSDGNEVQLLGMAAGGGVLGLLVTDLDGDPGPRLLRIAPDGTVADEQPVTGAPSSIELDAAGTAYVITSEASRADVPVIAVYEADGSTGSLTYEGISSPRQLSASVDGTLYVADAGLGVLSLGQVAGVPGASAGPPEAAPAVPLPGQASFTG
jgi:sugar lactone lactonase YvrE